MAMMHNNIMNYYERIFSIRQYHGWTITEIEDLFPWELDVMSSLISNYIETLELQRRQKAG
ncbi:base plate hub assembly catalyst [Synechococcus phage S-CRM01]|uniref:baseplate hub assembly catalyst n=1 Tax=Synechococcus phage S-CRM01 TaxID=1026955 RepID=UPI000209E368|nr:baseplate hub assembly catalyst [Synechococcus phage S-CRM01]AEC53009.1 base plate hub assembly catalyst [Synechococcus phage S-CRM01]